MTDKVLIASQKSMEKPWFNEESLDNKLSGKKLINHMSKMMIQMFCFYNKKAKIVGRSFHFNVSDLSCSMTTTF